MTNWRVARRQDFRVLLPESRRRPRAGMSRFRSVTEP